VHSGVNRKCLWHCVANFCSAALFVGKDLIHDLWSKKRHNSLCYSGSSCRETECWWLLQNVRIYIYIYIYIYILQNKRPNWCHLLFYFTSYVLNMFRTLIYPSSVVIQQNSPKLLMMDVLMSETCWAHKKWNKIASDIKLVFYSSTITMMHGPINIIYIYIYIYIYPHTYTHFGASLHMPTYWDSNVRECDSRRRDSPFRTNWRQDLLFYMLLLILS